MGKKKDKLSKITKKRENNGKNLKKKGQEKK